MAPLSDFDCQGKSSGRKVETTKSTASTIVVVCAKINQSLRIEDGISSEKIFIKDRIKISAIERT
jgi:hypothetical protein